MLSVITVTKWVIYGQVSLETKYQIQKFKWRGLFITNVVKLMKTITKAKGLEENCWLFVIHNLI